MGIKDRLARFEKAMGDGTRNYGQWIEAEMHRNLTNTCDYWFQEGYITRDERIALSAAVGSGLEAFTKALEEKAESLYKRSLYTRINEDGTVMESEARPTSPFEDRPYYGGYKSAQSSEVKKPVITPGGRQGNDRSTGSRSNGENWVEKTPKGELPKYIRTVRNGLMREGRTEDQATALAVAAIRRWAKGGDNVKPKVQAAAARALAEWEAMKKGGKKANPNRADEAVQEGMGRRGDKPKPTGNRRRGSGPGAESDWDESASRGSGRRVASAAGERRFGKPIGSVITAADRRRAKEGNPKLSDALKKRLPMKHGQQGKVIAQLQGALSKAGFQTEGDGIFGDKTEAAVKAAQKKYGLRPTGVVDEQLMVALIKAGKTTKKPKKK